MMGCLGEESHKGKGRRQGEGKKEYRKTEGREQERLITGKQAAGHYACLGKPCA